MPTIHLEAQISSDELIHAVSQLTGVELDILAERILTLRAQRHTPHLPRVESDLLLKINAGLADETWKRYSRLSASLRDETITAEEHRELLQLIDVVETDNAKRIGHLVELAGLRGLTLETLMSSLGIGPRSHA